MNTIPDEPDAPPHPPTFREVGAEKIRKHLDKMLSHAEGVRAAEDIEAVHDMRVGSRRLRAALSVFMDAFPDPEFPRFERSVKEVTDALGAARDLDVMLEALAKLDKSLPDEERAGMESFMEAKRRERDRLQTDVRRALDRLQERDLAAQWRGIVERCASAAAKRDGSESHG